LETRLNGCCGFSENKTGQPSLAARGIQLAVAEKGNVLVVGKVKWNPISDFRPWPTQARNSHALWLPDC